MSYPVTQQPSTDFGFATGGPKANEHIAGLESLMYKNEVKIKQIRPGCLELLNCWEYTNKYKVIDEDGSQMFFLLEQSDCCARQCFGQARPLQISFQSNDGQEILKFDRPLRCLECCCDSCYPNLTQLLEVYQNDRFLGRVREVPVCCTRKHLEVWNKNEEKIYDISGPCCPFSCGGSVPFPITDQSGTDVGEISKEWRGCMKESFTDLDTFKIEFPQNITLETKALLLGATMLVDFMYFEKNNNDNSN